MQRIGTIFQLLLSDERSSMRGRMAMLVSLLIVAIVVAGLALMSLSDQIYRNLDRRVLFVWETAGGELA